jgi:hypothetical protein
MTRLDLSLLLNSLLATWENEVVDSFGKLMEIVK